MSEGSTQSTGHTLVTILLVCGVTVISGMAGMQAAAFWDMIKPPVSATAKPSPHDIVTSPTASSAAEVAQPVSTAQIYLHAAQDGHFRANVRIGEHQIKSVVDTGAQLVTLPYRDAFASGLKPQPSDFRVDRPTANGRVKFALVTIPLLRIGGITVRDIDAFIAPPGKLEMALLGMSFLERMASVNLSGKDLLIHQ